MAYSVTLIPGDGIGPEITRATVNVLEATGIRFDWDIGLIGTTALDELGDIFPDSVLRSIRRNKVALKGPVTTPVGSGFRSVNVALRKKLDLYACVRPCKSYPGAPSPYQNIDIVVVRENTEDLYSGIEFEMGSPETKRLIELIRDTGGEILCQDAGISIKFITASASKRIVRFAFDYARSNRRRKVTAVHKANIMKYSDGIFITIAREVASEYRDIDFDERIVDNMAMQLVQKPHEFDVIVAPNLYGDILSDLCAGLVGGLGLAPGANLGDEIAIFEPTHGSAPKYAGLDRVNPMAMILSGVMMLRYLGEKEAALQVERAIASVIAEGSHVTYDLKRESSGNAVGTSRVSEAIIEKMA